MLQFLKKDNILLKLFMKDFYKLFVYVFIFYRNIFSLLIRRRGFNIQWRAEYKYVLA